MPRRKKPAEVERLVDAALERQPRSKMIRFAELLKQAQAENWKPGRLRAALEESLKGD